MCCRTVGVVPPKNWGPKNFYICSIFRRLRDLMAYICRTKRDIGNQARGWKVRRVSYVVAKFQPFVLPTPLPDCLCHVSFKRYSPLSVEVVEKPNKCKSFWPPIFSVLQQIVSDSPSAVWQSLVEFCLLISVSEAWQ